MKKILAIVILICIVQLSYAQKENWHDNENQSTSKKHHNATLLPDYKFGAGLDFSWPYTSLSGKLKVSTNSIFEALIGSNSTYFGTTNNRYSFRYNYAIPKSDINLFKNKSKDYFYLYGEVGLLTWSYDYDYYTGYYWTVRKHTYSKFGYSVGGGYEVIFSNCLGVNISAGLARSVYGYDYGYGFAGGCGVHYYFTKGKKPVKEEAAEANDDNDKQTDDENEDEKSDTKTKSKKSNTKTRSKK